MAQTDRHTNRCTWRIVDQIGSEGRFVEKMCDFCIKHKTIYESKSIHWPIWIRGRNSPPPPSSFERCPNQGIFFAGFLPRAAILIFNRPWRSHGLLDKHLLHSFIHSLSEWLILQSPQLYSAATPKLLEIVFPFIKQPMSQ